MDSFIVSTIPEITANHVAALIHEAARQNHRQQNIKRMTLDLSEEEPETRIAEGILNQAQGFCPGQSALLL